MGHLSWPCDLSVNRNKQSLFLKFLQFPEEYLIGNETNGKTQNENYYFSFHRQLRCLSAVKRIYSVVCKYTTCLCVWCLSVNCSCDTFYPGSSHRPDVSESPLLCDSSWAVWIGVNVNAAVALADNKQMLICQCWFTLHSPALFLLHVCLLAQFKSFLFQHLP